MLRPTDAQQPSPDAPDGAPAPEFVHPVTVRWADCDPASIAYTGRIPNFALEAIDAWWAAIVGFDWFSLNADRGYSTPFVHMSLDFLAPVTPRHVLECAVRPLRLGDTSIRFEVVGSQDGIRCFSGEFVSVFVTSSSFRKTPPVADIRALIAPHLPDATCSGRA